LCENLGLLGGLAALPILPVQPSADPGQEQKQPADQPAAISFGKALQFVAPQILINFAKECLATLGGKRQVFSLNSLDQGISCRRASFPILDERKLAARLV
jgi:hypothetical protein